MYFNKDNKFIESNGVRCIDVRWFQDVGIVISQDTVTFEYKAYIKTVAKDSTGSRKGNFGGPECFNWLDDQIERDVAFTMAYGNKYPLESAKLLFPQYEFIDGDFFEDIISRYPECFI